MESLTESADAKGPSNADQDRKNQVQTNLREKLKRLEELRKNISTKPIAAQSRAPEAKRSESTEKAQPATSSSPEKVPASQQIRSVDKKKLREDLKSSKIMIVDDEKTNVLTVRCFLEKEGYRSFISTTDSRRAIDAMIEHRPDVLLLDINMPHVSGLEVLREISNHPTLSHIPVLILTAATDPEIKREALDLGANDFLKKPVDPHDLIPRVQNALFVKLHLDHMTNQAAQLEAIVQERTAELFQSRQQLIISLARAAEHRDNETGNHVIRVGRYAGLIAKSIGWEPDQVKLLEQAAQLHDVGKIGIPDSILFKPGKLEPQEYDYMKRHCAIGKEIIEPLSEKDFEIYKSHVTVGDSILRNQSSPMLLMASRIAQTHHERWDGTGYPVGLSGEDIPIEGRITAIADVFDALSSSRPYKKAFSREKCFEILEEGRGTHFDPVLLEAFFSNSEEIIKVQLDFMDASTAPDQKRAMTTEFAMA